ncbi:radical SAM family heme chaperone HemW [Mesobacterium pallidum]|uniref:radical SAM family heme chaperone HemW n=1 Tax=Mesobacterium pallidum TaxID=2872037 RepID=UPI001EE296D9|nr:radical SAM family heme chaperone HemW [Mesobacterium pallidum]
MAEDWQNGGFGLYIHWPWCQSKCPYCDFNSHVAAFIDQDRWAAAYVAEIERMAALTGPRVLNSVFFGGGTPSLMAPETVDAVLTAVRRAWPLANDLEVTLEANPGSVEAGRFRGYAQAGVNRVSMGIQALNNRDLRRLGRLHSVEEARAAFDIARAQFDRVSFDLIYARQDQTLHDWRSELTEALEMAVDHLSMYQLTIEPGTAFGDRFARGGLHGLPDEDISADMYDLTQDLCGEAGLLNYEVSNHARPGAESRHNLVYWRYGDYVGIGPGAHGRVTLDGVKHATEAERIPGKWLENLSIHGKSESWEVLDGTEQALEMLLMGMRLGEGIDPARFAALNGAPLNPNAIDRLTEMGMLKPGPRLIATQQGRVLLNAVLRELVVE